MEYFENFTSPTVDMPHLNYLKVTGRRALFSHHFFFIFNYIWCLLIKLKKRSPFNIYFNEVKNKHFNLRTKCSLSINRTGLFIHGSKVGLILWLIISFSYQSQQHLPIMGFYELYAEECVC